MATLATRYNTSSRLFDGRCARMEVFAESSGATMESLAGTWNPDEHATKPRPQVWIPASSAWLVLLAQRGPQVKLVGADKAGRFPSVAKSPLVLAVPKSIADQVGGTIGWSDLLRIAGDGTGVFAGILLGGFFNLIALVLVAPVVSRRLRGSRPAEIADDRAGTIAVLGVTVVLAAIGLAHAGAVDDAKQAMGEQLAAARRYFAREAPPEYRVNAGHIDVWKQSDSLFRTCIPGPDADHALCVFVNTETEPPDVRLDPAHVPNPR